MLELNANLENLGDFVAYTRNAAQVANLSDDSAQQIELVTEEAIVNIINYAYPNTVGMVHLSCTTEPEFFVMQISDSGIPFNPLKSATPDINADINTRPIGGLGIFLMKQYMDDLQYRYENRRNILVLKKELAQHSNDLKKQGIKHEY